jgi:hypothetical protein
MKKAPKGAFFVPERETHFTLSNSALACAWQNGGS